MSRSTLQYYTMNSRYYCTLVRSFGLAMSVLHAEQICADHGVTLSEVQAHAPDTLPHEGHISTLALVIALGH